MKEILEGQLEAFRRKFGREPGPGDPIFFDPAADEPRPIDVGALELAMLTAMEAADVRPELIHAYRRTGLIVTEDNHRSLSKEDRAAWRAALEEYEQLKKQSN